MKNIDNYKIDEKFKIKKEEVKDIASIILISDYIYVFLKELERGKYKVDLEEIALLCITLYEKYSKEKIENETLNNYLIRNEKEIKVNFLNNLNIERTDIGLIN